MRWELVLWPAVALVSPALVNLIWPRLSGGEVAALLSGSMASGPGSAAPADREDYGALGDLEPYLRSFAPWLHGIGPAYLALITGAVHGREFGIAGLSPEQWIGGGVLCLVWIAVTSRLIHPAGSWPKPTRGVLDEPRWALYRAAGSAGIGSQPWGALIGLALALAELGLRTVTHRGGRKPPWESVARAASSCLLFVLTGSFWLTLLTQGITLYLLSGAKSQWD